VLLQKNDAVNLFLTLLTKIFEMLKKLMKK